MRCRFSKCLALCLVLFNAFVLWKIYKLLLGNEGLGLKFLHQQQHTTSKPAPKHISKQTTIVLRDFDLNENDVSGTVASFVKVFPNIQILLVTNGNPYPPLQINYNMHKNVRSVNLSPSFNTPYLFNPLSLIKTPYVLFVPDSSRIIHRQVIQTMINALSNDTGSIIAVPYSLNRNLSCLNVEIIPKEWAIKFTRAMVPRECGFVSGKHAILVELNTLYKLNNPFLMPHPHSLYLLTSLLNIKVKILQNVQFHDGKSIFYSHHAQRLKNKADKLHLKHLYESFGIKKSTSENGVSENFGCSRDTARCFGNIINYTPSYVYEGKQTPPCCLQNLRVTAKHVFAMLEEAGIRYWLEGASLLGAMRHGDIIPWDYDVDIGFNRDDLNRCVWLKRAKSKPVTDSKGFVWEKATEGHFYRILYSKVNRIYVNLLPFYAKNGTMVKDNWFTSQVNADFPDHYLHPMASIEFVGRTVPSPNNIRDFLEYKFSPGIIEDGKIPDFKSKFT